MKNSFYLTVVISALLSLAGWTAHAQLQRGTSPTRQIWEYKTILLMRTSINENWSSWFEDDKPIHSAYERGS